ncbi:MAG TPA: aminoacyl-tRNA hydrolase [Syntrophales bacterium]|nr:aminoacyl-tRNA hydrolase [Syntrophales bacterium]
MLYIIIGLGNPGGRYCLTRHNLGFMVVDELARRYAIQTARKKFRAEVGEGAIEGAKAVLIKPHTYMNLCGLSVREAVSFFKPEPGRLIVVHDDLDLEPGRIQIRKGGGAGGHKGLASIIEHLGTPDFIRVRLGIGKPAVKEMVEDYVLQHFPPDELEGMAGQVSRASDAVAAIISAGLQEAMNRFNVRKRSAMQEETKD